MSNRFLPNHQAFTCKYPQLVARLTTSVSIESANEKIDGIALWDTGATGTCISRRVVKDLNLVPVGKTIIKTPSGSKECDTYLVNIKLPNHVIVVDVKVTETEIGDQGIDLLIGMNIIAKGDFAISNFNGATSFTFRVPSVKDADYVKEINVLKAIGQSHGPGKRKHRRKN